MHLSHGPSHREWQTGYKFSSIINKFCKGFLIYTSQTELQRKNCRKNWPGASAGPNTKEMEVARTNVKKKWCQHHQIGAEALQWTPQGHRGRGRPRNTWRRDLEKEMWTDSRIQVQLEEDGGGSTRQRELDGDKWSVTYRMFHREPQGIYLNKSKSSNANCGRTRYRPTCTCKSNAILILASSCPLNFQLPSRPIQNQNVNVQACKLNTHLLTFDWQLGLLQQNLHFVGLHCMAWVKYHIS